METFQNILVMNVLNLGKMYKVWGKGIKTRGFFIFEKTLIMDDFLIV